MEIADNGSCTNWFLYKVEIVQKAVLWRNKSLGASVCDRVSSADHVTLTDRRVGRTLTMIAVWHVADWLELSAFDA